MMAHPMVIGEYAAFHCHSAAMLTVARFLYPSSLLYGSRAQVCRSLAQRVAAAAIRSRPRRRVPAAVIVRAAIRAGWVPQA